MLDKLRIREAQKVLHAIGSEIRMSRAESDTTVFLKPMAARDAMAMMDYVLHLEEQEKIYDQSRKVSFDVAEKLGKVVLCLDGIKNIKNLPPEARAIVERAFGDLQTMSR
jgi:hypothetical protein